MQSVLPELSLDEVCSVCSRRLSRMTQKASSDNVEDLLTMEEAAECLDKDDQRMLQKMGAHGKVKAAEAHEYRQQVIAKRRSLPSSSGRAGSSSGHRSAALPRVSIPQRGVIPHESASQMKPPGSFVWRALTEGAWLGRLPPHGEVSRSWRRHGEREACLQVLRHLWQQYLDLQGWGEDSCPIIGLFGPQEPGPGSASDVLAQASAPAPKAKSAARAKPAPALPKPRAKPRTGRR